MTEQKQFAFTLRSGIPQCVEERLWWLKPENVLMQGDAGELASRLAQYSFLPRHIAGMFQMALPNLSAWPAVHEEISDNMGDELGQRTGEVPHFDILCAGVQRELGLDLRVAKASESTQRFIVAMERQMRIQDPNELSGCLCALEVTAIPELRVVAAMINAFAAGSGLSAPIRLGEAVATTSATDFRTLPLHDFFALHVGTFEVDHRDHLATAVLEHIDPGGELCFQCGFWQTCYLMDVWFSSMVEKT